MTSNTNPEPSTVEAKAVDYTKLIPFISAGLILLGVSKLFIYFGLFGINILSFLEFSEIITSFLNWVIVSIVTIVFVGSSLINLALMHNKEEGSKSTSKKLIKRERGTPLFAVAVLCLLIPAILATANDSKVLTTLLILTILTIPGVMLFYRHYQKSKSKLIKDLCLTIIALIISGTCTMLATIIDYRSVVKDKQFVGTKIIFNNETFLKDSLHIFVSDSANFYIGKTNNYIFIHHMEKGITSVYPMSSVIQIDFKTRRTLLWHFLHKTE